MRWLVAMELPIRQPVSCVAWANALGRPTELVAVASGKTATLYSLSGPADALQASISPLRPLSSSQALNCVFQSLMRSTSRFLLDLVPELSRSAGTCSVLQQKWKQAFIRTG